SRYTRNRPSRDHSACWSSLDVVRSDSAGPLPSHGTLYKARPPFRSDTKVIRRPFGFHVGRSFNWPSEVNRDSVPCLSSYTHRSTVLVASAVMLTTRWVPSGERASDPK